jgi:hypothetical protein
VIDSTEPMGMYMNPEPDQVLALEARLSRVQGYARALEERCHRLWSYIPGNEGSIDPTLAFLADELEVTDADLDR